MRSAALPISDIGSSAAAIAALIRSMVAAIAVRSADGRADDCGGASPRIAASIRARRQ